MAIYELKAFSRWRKSEPLTNATLKHLVLELEKGKFETALGAGLYKKRLAKEGAGKRGGYRILLAWKSSKHTIFLIGFAKNEKANITSNHLKQFKSLAKQYFKLSDSAMTNLVLKGHLVRI